LGGQFALAILKFKRKFQFQLKFSAISADSGAAQNAATGQGTDVRKKSGRPSRGSACRL
jgi:hypothetical protein